MNGPGLPSPLAAPSSGVPPAAPRSFGQILDRIFHLLRANLKPFLGIASVPAGTMIVLYAVMGAVMLLIMQPWHHPNPAVMPMKVMWLMVAWFAVYALFMLLFALYFPAAVYAGLQADAGGKASCREAYAAAWRKAGRYVWLMILSCVIVVGPILVLGVIVGGGIILLFAGKGNANSAPMLMIPLVIVFYLGAMIYGIVMGLWLSLACPACVAEDLTAWAAIRRSFGLTSGAKGRIFLLLLVIYALVYAGMLVVELGIGVIAAIGVGAGMVLHLALNPWGFIGIGMGAILLLAAMFAMMACSWAGYCTTFAVVYHDQRLRMEGIGAVPVQAG